MVGVFGAGMTVHFNPKDLGLSDGVSRTVFRLSRLDRVGQLQDELLDHRLAHVCCLCYC